MATRSPSWWIKIRLADIDAPESRQAFGARSKQALSDLCFQQEARLETQGRDRYGRTIAAVYCDGRSANAAQGWQGTQRVSSPLLVNRILSAGTPSTVARL